VFDRDFTVRDAVAEDEDSIRSLVETLTHKEHLLADIAQYYAAKRDPVCIIAVSVVPT